MVQSLTGDRAGYGFSRKRGPGGPQFYFLKSSPEGRTLQYMEFQVALWKWMGLFKSSASWSTFNGLDGKLRQPAPLV